MTTAAEKKTTAAAKTAEALPDVASCLSLRQKLVEMRKACPEILKKKHSDGVSYSYAKIYDVWEKITPIMNQLGVDFDVIAETATKHSDNGDPLWYKNVKDEQGNITGRITTNDYAQADYYYVDKSSLPKVYGGFNTAFSYKGFELSAIFAYSIGGYIVDRDVTMLWSNGSNPGRAWSTEILKRWTPENRYTDVPALKTVSNNWNSNSTRNLFNNSYLRMKNITLSYNFPQPLIKKISLNSLQLFVQADNLLTFSKNQGLDPEQGITGLTYYRYPAMRSISGGLNVSF